MRAIGHDLRHGVRLLVRQPGTSILAVLTLALGIGVSSAIFSLVDAVMLRDGTEHNVATMLATMFAVAPKQG